MSKLRVLKAVEMFEVSQSGIYRDIDNGTISYEKDERGKKVIDVAELQRVYELREDGNSQKEKTGMQLITKWEQMGISHRTK